MHAKYDKIGFSCVLEGDFDCLEAMPVLYWALDFGRILMMKIAIAYNPQGTQLAERIKACLAQLGHTILDFSENDTRLDDADIAYAACKKIPNEHVDRAILICGAGLCSCIVANKIEGLYAAACQDVFEAHQARERYNTNVLCLSARWVDPVTAQFIVKEWLATPFRNSARNGRALEKIRVLEKGLCPSRHGDEQKDSVKTV